MANDWMSALARPQSTVLKQFLFQLMKDKWHLHEDILDRISPQLVTQKDMEAFSKLLIDVWESAYFKSVQDHKAVLEPSGVKTEVVPESLPLPQINKKIFK